MVNKRNFKGFFYRNKQCWGEAPQQGAEHPMFGNEAIKTPPFRLENGKPLFRNKLCGVMWDGNFRKVCKTPNIVNQPALSNMLLDIVPDEWSI